MLAMLLLAISVDLFKQALFIYLQALYCKSFQIFLKSQFLSTSGIKYIPPSVLCILTLHFML